MKAKINVCLLFGGKSGEHEVSLQSAKSVYDALDKNKYEVFLVGIDKNGKWLLGDNSSYLLNSTNPTLIKLNNGNSTAISPLSTSTQTQLVSLQSGKDVAPVDVFFPVTHGTYGEDGCLQGLLEFTNAAYVGAGVLGSAIGMDKDVMKRLFKEAKIPVADFISFNKYNYSKKDIDKFIAKNKFPVFVKPANLGSSVGITKVHNLKKLEEALKKALKYDNKVLIEKCIEGREIECSVLGNENPKASIPGEVIHSKKYEFYSYTAKYIDEDGAELIIPANISKNTTKKIQELAIKVFKVLNCEGMARVDFFLSKNKIIVNELNSLPGFTKISMYPKLWEATGVPYARLLDILISLAIEKKKHKDRLKRTFDK